jgi:hypothetical protein
MMDPHKKKKKKKKKNKVYNDLCCYLSSPPGGLQHFLSNFDALICMYEVLDLDEPFFPLCCGV